MRAANAPASLERGGTVEQQPAAHANGTFLQPGPFGSENARKQGGIER
jgi:hypothetical protein